MVMTGITPVIYYDPPQRVIRTDLPDGTFSRLEFDPWWQATWDQNDTVKDSAWFAERMELPADAPGHRAANLALAHAETPAIAHLDTLGRTFLMVADNGPAGKYETRVELDVEGNQRTVTDALGRTVMAYDYDLLGTVVHHSASMDAGERWMLGDVAGNPIRSWDSRGHIFRTKYDELPAPARAALRARHRCGPISTRTSLTARCCSNAPNTARASRATGN